MIRTTSFTDYWDRQPDPTPATVRQWSPTPQQWPVAAAIWLLALWTQDSVPGWQWELATGKALPRSDQQWREAPALAEIAEIGDFPATFDPATPSGQRYPVAATVLTSLVTSGPRTPFEHEPAREEVRDQVVALLTERIAVRDRRGEQLIQFIANELAGEYADLLLVRASPEPDGEPAADELHLLCRDTWGAVLRLSLAPSPQVQQPPVFAADGADAMLRTRIGCISTLLSDFIYVNNNNSADFRVRIDRPDGIVGGTDVERIATAAAWWVRSREDDETTDVVYDEELGFVRVSSAELAAGIENIARGGLRDLHDDDWDGDEPYPEIPDDHLVRFLYHDLIDLLIARIPGPDGGPPLIVSSGYLPLSWLSDDELSDDETTKILLIGADEVAAIEIDLSC